MMPVEDTPGNATNRICWLFLGYSQGDHWLGWLIIQAQRHRRNRFRDIDEAKNCKIMFGSGFIRKELPVYPDILFLLGWLVLELHFVFTFKIRPVRHTDM